MAACSAIRPPEFPRLEHQSNPATGTSRYTFIRRKPPVHLKINLKVLVASEIVEAVVSYQVCGEELHGPRLA